jgi:hypothetical protein
MKRLISLTLFGLTVGTLWSLSRQLREAGHREAARPKAKPVPVQTWEGEGGALPATGSQMGPDPVVPASTGARPADTPGTVH